MYSVTEFLKSNARATPGAPATRHLGRNRSWTEMQDRVARLASAIRAMGVASGDRVAILALNSDRYLEYYFAVWWAGAAVVPMNTRWSAEENAYALGDAGAKVLFIDDAFAPMLKEMTAELSLTHIVFTGEDATPEGCLDYESLIAANEPCEDAERGGDDLAGLYYTGGTTGFPKGVMLSQQALWFNNLSVSSGSSYQMGDVYLHAGPMFHLADGAFSGAACTNGLCHTFLPSFDLSKVMDLLEAEKVTHTLMVPTMLGMLVNHPDFDPGRLSALRSVAYGASPMPEGLMHTLLERLPNIGWMQGYGQTEMAPIITLLPAENHTLEGPNAGKMRSAGRAAPGVEVRICDEDGKDLPNGEVGEIVARAPGSMSGYWNRPEQTEATLSGGWVKTGDGAYRDDDGFIFIVDRLKDMIVTGGENVFSAEVENAVSTHPAVAAVSVIGIPDERWGEAVHAIVILQEGQSVTVEELIEHTHTIANYKRPRSISFRDEPFPLSGAGKILKTELRKPFWDNQDRGVS
ncbi:acyl-CoA synthetase [Congregibacter litoralis]|uniref:Acyl-CoA synthetase (AMP-forming)/AMP-acid ligase II n=1 Tax=Congregibacter litoralis KT71 TaxID=314285 RepID=A4A722_9GAMM|nr:long-chain fatty acid--CoA ligase [Congregibacter litoralis]EAQ98091.1 Acyl-CoA synthetase (AMP-forming)/AMP-acid ligase II [Congregibacter litoralis KT71]